LNFGGTAEATPAEGDFWYDSGKFNFGTSQVMAGVWSSGGNLAVNGKSDAAGAGTQTAALLFGGQSGWYTDNTEEYDGTSWTAGGTSLCLRQGQAGAGTQTAALCFGGDGFVKSPNAGAEDYTEEYDGTSWSGAGLMGTGRKYLAGAGTQTAALAMGGWWGDDIVATEHYNGTSWSAGGDMLTAREKLAGAGTQTAALCFGGDGAWGAGKKTEEYNGTSWSAGGDLPSYCQLLGGAGTQTAGLCMGGWEVYDEDEWWQRASSVTQDVCNSRMYWQGIYRKVPQIHHLWLRWKCMGTG
jgi:hypothetical protein